MAGQQLRDEAVIAKAAVVAGEMNRGAGLAKLANSSYF